MKKFLDLGLQPLANSYVSKKNLHLKEKKFKLILGFNPKNYLVSILNTVPKEKMFNKDYPYKSSESKTMKTSFMELTKKNKRNPRKVNRRCNKKRCLHRTSNRIIRLFDRKSCKRRNKF